MANIVPNFNSKRIFFVSEDLKLQEKVLHFIEEWNNENDFFTANTSGSTGIPKEIKLDKKIAIAAVKLSNNYFKFEEMHTLGLCLSPETIGGKMQILRALVYNLNVYIFDNKRNPFENLEKQIDFVTLVPLQMEAILKENPEKFNFISKILLGGAQVSSSLKMKLDSITSECYESYGMTETYSHIAIKNLSAKEKYFSCLDGVSCKIEKENLVVFANHLQVDGFKTNDSANLIDSKHFEILGRTDFVINSGGYKFHPEVLEEKLEAEIQHGFFIIGEPDMEFGEIVTFYMESTYSKDSEKAINEIFRRKLNRFEIPKKIYFVDKFICTTSGKIDKLKTQKQLLEH